MYCQMCGAGMPENADFCPQCGARRPLAPGEAAPAAPDAGAHLPPGYGAAPQQAPEYGGSQPPIGAPPSQGGYGQPQYGQGQYGQPPYGGPPPSGGQWSGGYYQPQAAPRHFYAGFWPRVGASLLDSLFALLLALIPAIILAVSIALVVQSGQEEPRSFAQEQQQEDDVALGAVVGAMLGYIPVAVGYLWVANSKGGGWGKRIVGMRIVRVSDGQPPGWGSGLIRTIAPWGFSLASIIPIAGSVVPLLDNLWCIWDEKKQTWHDKIAGTIVIEA